MLAVSGCGNYILIALQVLNVDGFEDCELSTKFRAETRGDMEKIMACFGHQNYTSYLKMRFSCLYKAL